MSNECIELTIAPELRGFGFKHWDCDWKNRTYRIELRDFEKIEVTYEKGQDVSKIASNVIFAVAKHTEKDLKKPEFTQVVTAIEFAIAEADREAFELEQNEKDDSNDNENKGRRKQKRKEKTLSPVELEEKEANQRYIEEVEELREQFTKNKVTYQQWQKLVAEKYIVLRETINLHFPGTWEIMEFCLAIKCVLNIKGNTLPFMGVLLAVPSSNKTAILQLFQKYALTYYLDQLTPQAFCSHNSSKSEEELQRDDIIPNMKNKLFITPELAPLFTRNEDELKATIGMITRLMDGKGYSNATGAHGKRGYPAMMFAWIGAAVEIPKSVWKLLGLLGFKIYFLRPEITEMTEDELINDTYATEFKKRISGIEDKLFDYLKTFDSVPESDKVSRLIEDSNIVQIECIKDRSIQDQLTATKYIVKLARLLRHLRGTIDVYTHKKYQGKDRDDDEDYLDFTVDQPILERATRARDILILLAMGHALSRGSDVYGLEDMPLVFKVGLSSAMKERVKLFNLLTESKNGSIAINTVCSKLSFSRPTARKIMREFYALGLVGKSEGGSHKSMNITLKDNFSWFTSDEYNSIIKRTQTEQDSKSTEKNSGVEGEE